MEYQNIRQNGLIAIGLKEEDDLIEVKLSNNEEEIILGTKHGQCIRFDEKEVRITGRTSQGVRGMNLNDGDEVIGMQLISQGEDLLIISENGFGKRTKMEQFTPQRRGGKGVKFYKIMGKTGNVVGMKAVHLDDEMIIISQEGIIIRIRVGEVSRYGRITSGVKIMNVDKDIHIAALARIKEIIDEEVEDEVIDIKSSEVESTDISKD